MLLVAFATLLTLGFSTFLIGHYFGYTGVASVGAVIIIGVGGAVAMTDLRMQTGKTVDNAYTTAGNQPVVDNQTISYEYDTVSVSKVLGGAAGPFSIGALVMLIGGLLMTQHLNEVATQ